MPKERTMNTIRFLGVAVCALALTLLTACGGGDAPDEEGQRQGAGPVQCAPDVKRCL
jgi:hypothetical protein